MSAAVALTSSVDAVLATDRSGWTDAQRQEWLLVLRREADRLAGAQAELLAEVAQAGGGQVLGPDGLWSSVPGWLADAERVHVNTAAAQVRAADRLAALPLVRRAVQDGSIRPGHAEVLAALVGRVDPAHLAAAEPVLLAMAQEYHPAALRGRVRIWLAEHCPELFDADEDRAADSGWLQIDTLGDGRHRIHGHLPSGPAEALLTALAALSRRCGPDDRRPLRQRRADALIELARHALASGGLPETGGLPTQISLVLPCDPITGRPAPVATAPYTGPLAPWLTALHSCDAQLTPIALQGGQVIALGRTTRVVSPAQRKALAARDGHCVTYGCDAPPSRCDAHHLTAWADGGHTNLDNLALLCRHHHTQWHRGRLGRHQLKIPWDDPPHLAG